MLWWSYRRWGVSILLEDPDYSTYDIGVVKGTEEASALTRGPLWNTTKSGIGIG